ncbi:MAG: hypothetical protein SFU86_00845, partial [Pirellulaceae bacterium]|nr:hypothetical protein [Pirellulaceae bacterium]
RRAVQETVMQDQAVTAFQPVTTMQTQLVDQSSLVSSWGYVPGRTRNRLMWAPRGVTVDPFTGQTAWRRGGLSWVPQTAPGVLRPVTTFVPNVVAQQVPVTSMQPVQFTQQVPVTVNRLVDEVVTQQVPVTVTRFHDEVVTQQIPVTVRRIEQVEEVRDVPVTVQRPVTERVEVKTPIQTVRYEEEVHTRQVPYQVRRIETEEVTENYDVQVCRYVTETKTVQVPKQVGRWIPQQTNRLVPRTVTMRVPLGTGYDSIVYEGAVTTFDAPVYLPPTTSAQKVEVRRVPAPAPTPALKATPTPTPATEKSLLKKDELTPADPQPAGEPKDSDPTGEPKLDLNGPKTDDKGT